MNRAIVLLAAVAVFLLAATALSALRIDRDFDVPRASRSASAPTPDVCKTPAPGSPVPIPYVNRGEGQLMQKDPLARSVPSRSATKTTSRAREGRWSER
jgi:hypothetical protein